MSGGSDGRGTARAKRKFAVGALEQAAQILGAMSAGVLVAGLIGPYFAAFAGSGGYSPETVLSTAAIALAVAFSAAVGAMVLRGWSRRADDDDLRAEMSRARTERERS